MNKEIHVVAGVLRDDRGRVLLTQIPSGKHLAGAWEFPGGKCETGEAAEIALQRELREELGVAVGRIERLISVPWQYPNKKIRLDAFRVHDFSGVPEAREGQALRWYDADNLRNLEMPDADRPIATALRLPSFYAISPEPGEDDSEFLAGLERTIANGATLVQLRMKRGSADRRRNLARAARDIAARFGAKLLLNGDMRTVDEFNLDGIHLPAAQLLTSTSRPLNADRFVAASCHDARELAHAAAIGVDFVVLGSVCATTSHASVPLGWNAFAELCSQTPLPVYALGGLGANDLDRARRSGAIGVAGISAFWRAT